MWLTMFLQNIAITTYKQICKQISNIIFWFSYFSMISISMYYVTDDVICEEGYTKCEGGGQCIQHKFWCDYFIDCPNASDEANCSEFLLIHENY